MTSRRPMTRSFSGNGRTSSFSEEEGSSSNGRSESRNTYLSNVRPENRSTLCSVMAQLTEDIQPSFETTLKSKAVSENCNVKFTCVVSGYPAPELKWYKDDMEMDRYCGLPKYEIHRNGKTHTLHIYNCTLDDAAIYQVSASNRKGIVSCSGVLEVGTMNEYKIHQRFFAKLKQKAEKKKRDIEEKGKKDNKENIKKEEQQSSPEHPYRKRSVPPLEEKPVVNNSATAEQPGDVAQSKALIAEGKDAGDIASVNSSLEKEESAETLAKKRIKMSNGVDIGVNTNISKSHMMGNGGENLYDGGISLAQFLAETIQTQSGEESQEEKETSIVTLRDNKENDTEEKLEEQNEQECISEKRRQEEIVIDKEKKKENQPEAAHTTTHSRLQKPSSSEVKHCSKSQKDHDQHNIHTSISSMLHSVKDFFFGKSKKDSYNISHTDNEDEHFDHSTVLPEPGMPPSFQLQAGHSSEVLENDVVPMETDKASEPSEIVKQQAAPAEPIQFNCEDTGLLQDHKLIPEIVNESAGKRIEEANETVEAMEESTEAERSSPVEKKSLSGFQVQAEEGKKNSEIVSTIEEELPQDQGTGRPLVLQKPNPDSGRDDSLSQKDKEHSLPPPLLKVEDYCTLPQSVISLTENHNPGVALMETLEKEEVSVLNVDKETPDIQEYHSSHRLSKEEKAEVKSNKQPCLDINKSEITKISFCFPEDKIKQCESETPNRVLPALPATVAYSAEKDHLKEEAKRSSLIQEANVAYPPSEVPQCLEMGDLKSQREQATVVEEIAEDHQRKTLPSLNFKEMCEVKEKYSSASRDDVKMNWCNSLKTQEQLSLQVDNREVRSESSQLESIKDTILDDEELSKPKTLVVTEDNANSTYVLEEHSKTSYSKSNDLAWSAEHDCSTVNIPSVQISTTEDIPDIKLPMPEMNMSEEFIIPTINTMEPDLKECTLPLSILVQNKPGLNDLQKHDETHESKTGIQEQREADFPGTVPTQRGMQHTDDLSPTEKLKEVAQEMDEHQSSAQLPLMECASIPVINVSCSDDLESNTLGISSGGGTENEAFETQTETLFVVPPISVSCHESGAELKPPAPTKTTETETSADTPRGTKQGITENLSEKPEIPKRKKYLKEISDKSLKENTPSMVGETPMSKVGGSMPTFSKPTDDNIVPEALKQKSPKDAKRESSVEDFLKNRPSVERLSSKPPTYPSLSPSSLRKFMSKAAPELDNETTANVPAISVEDRQSDKADEDFSGGSTPTSSLSCESSPRLKRRDSLTLIRSATPEELASGARRKIFIPKREEELEGAVFSVLEGKKESPYMSPSQARRATLLQASTGQKTPPMERRSPLMSRRKATLEVPKVVEETPTIEPTSAKVEEKPAGKKTDPLKAPQVIRKIRGEPFPDASGHLKLWCQFFNVLSDSTIKWFKDEEEILEMKRSGGDESQVALAVVHASSQDCGVYGCSISNEYGTDTTDFLLSEEILSEFLLKEDLEVGEEIEMTPLVFTKGLADSGTWGEKYFGRIFTETVHIGEGCTHKASRVKVIYGLDPIFESGSTCIIKVRNPIAYGTKQESTLAERNLDIAKQECKVQDMIREYCKIFAAEARVNENFGFSLEVIPRYLIHRPANSVPYATVETDLTGDFGKYCTIDLKGKLFSQNISELDQKCCTFQHWIHQWTHGNLLVTQLEGVETKITNIKVATKSKGYQGLTECGSPQVFDQFVMYHQCNYYCGLLGLRALKTDLQQPAKLKGSRSPLLNRKLGSNSPQLQKKGQSPQMSRKTNVSPKVARKAQETDNNNSDEKQKPAEGLS